MLFTFENRFLLMRLEGGGASLEKHFSFPLMNSINRTKASIFPMQALLRQYLRFSQIIYKQATCK